MSRNQRTAAEEREWDRFWDHDQVFQDTLRRDFADFFPARVQAELTRRLPPPEECRVIEVGGGGGRFLVKFMAAGYRTTALDLSTSGLEQVEDLSRAMGVPAECIHADVFDIPETHHGQYDLVFSMAFCEHFLGEERRSVFVQHARLARPGGLVMIMVPNLLSPFRMFWRGGRRLLSAIPLLRRKLGIRWVDEHQYTAWELRRLVESAGLSVHLGMGSSLVEDAYFFVWGGLKKAMMRPFRRDARLRRGKFLEWRTPLDDVLGGHLFVVATRSEGHADSCARLHSVATGPAVDRTLPPLTTGEGGVHHQASNCVPSPVAGR